MLVKRAHGVNEVKERYSTSSQPSSQSMTGGMAFEAMNQAAYRDVNMLVILNDNKISIDSSTGAMSKYLLSITASPAYNRFKNRMWNLFTFRSKQSNLCKNFLGPFVLTFFVALFVLLMQFLWKWVDELVGKGLEIGLLLKLLFYASITLSSMAFPLAVLLASLMTFGNMGERYEIVALKSAGISIRRLMMPLAILSLVISLVAFEFSNEIIPRASVKLRMMLFDIQEQKPRILH